MRPWSGFQGLHGCRIRGVEGLTKRIIQCLSHSIEAFDMLRLYHGLGIEAFDLGGYINPGQPHDPKRPALPEVPFFPDLKAVVDGLGQPDNLGAAQSYIPDELLEWLGDDGALVWHHYLDSRLVPQWERLRDWKRGAPGRRVIWRTVGQSTDNNERLMAPLHDEGLEIVRYSPKERAIPGYAGEDAVIRFYKDPAEFGPWVGDIPAVINVTQDLFRRSCEDDGTTKPIGQQWTNYTFWADATKGMPAVPMGPGSEAIGGTGTLTYPKMREMLARGRVYLYTGTQPASYTLGLIEAMMSGIPTVSIPATYMRIWPYGPDLFEGPDIVGWSSLDESDDGHGRTHGQHVANTRELLMEALREPDLDWSARMRERAIELFGIETIGAQWKAYLG